MSTSTVDAPGSDMSFEDAAEVQQDLLAGSNQQHQEQQEQDGSNPSVMDLLADAAANSDAATVASSQPATSTTELAHSQEEQEEQQQQEYSATEAVNASTSLQGVEDERSVVAAPAVDSPALPQESTALEGGQASAIADEEQQEMTTTQQEKQQQSTNATLDALLGSLSAAPSAQDDTVTAATELASEPLQRISSETTADMDITSTPEPQVQVDAVTSTNQSQDPSSSILPSSASEQTAANGESSMTGASSAFGQQADGEQAIPSTWSNPTSFATLDPEGPVPGLPISTTAPPSIDAAAASSNTEEISMSTQETPNISAPEQASQSFSQIQQQPTPVGTPTLAASYPPSFPQQGQGQAQGQPSTSTSSSLPQQVPQASTSSKPTPLSTNPSIAYSTAQNLLANKPSTLSRLGKLKQRLELDKFDGEAWLELLNDALSKGDLDKTREVYDGFLRYFPDNAREWIAYADLELSHGNNERVNEIFGRCLRTSTSVQLWHFYLTYIRRTNPIDRSSAERALPARDIISKAFEFSLAHVGSDIESGPIWYDYIEFLKEGEVTGTWEAQQKMDKLRQTYQRAVCIPLANVEQIWQGYDAFENNLNRATAKRFLQDRSPAYMTARATARKLQSYMNRLTFSRVPHRPDWNSSADQKQLQIWKDMLKYEESDPMELADPAMIRTRVILAYKKALTQLRFYPEIWYMAAAFAQSQDKADEATNFYKAGMEANPTSLLLHYAYAESEERKSHNEECHKVYNGLIERLQSEIDSTNTAMQTDIKEALAEKERRDAMEKAARAGQNMMSGGYDEEIGEDVRIQERENIRTAITESKMERITELRRLAASVWIMQMRFARRAEGIQPARSVFSRARKWPHVTWHVFEASAMLEMHWNKETKIATNVFEVGLKRFSEEVGFVKRYLDFLIMVNDDGNARAVFERTITKFPADKARPLWNRWAEYLYQYGDLASIQKIDARLQETYPDEPPIDRFVERHTYLDLDDMAYVDLGEDDNLDSRAPKRQPSPEAAAPIKQEPMVPAMPPMMAPQAQQPILPPSMQGIPLPPQMPPQQIQNQNHNQNGPPMSSMIPPSHQAMPVNEGWGRNMNNAIQQPGPPSVDGSVDNDRRRGGRGGNKRRRSPSPPARRGRRASPPRVSRHTPPDDFPEGIPWLMSQLPSKTVFAAHGPILDWQHLYHLISTIPLPATHDQNRGRDRSPSPHRRGQAGGRRRSPDYNNRNRR